MTGVQTCALPISLTNFQCPKEIQEHFRGAISPHYGACTFLGQDSRARPATPKGFCVLKILSNTKAITESWMTHRKAAETKELEIPRRYTEDSTASKATNERARATLDQVRSGCSPLRPGVLSMFNDSYRRRRGKEGRIGCWSSQGYRTARAHVLESVGVRRVHQRAAVKKSLNPHIAGGTLA